MAFRKTLIQRIFNLPRISTPTLTYCRVSSASSSTCLSPTQRNSDQKLSPDPGDSRRFLHKKALFNPEIRSLPVGDKLLEKLRDIDITKNRINLDGLRFPSIEDAKKLLRFAQLEMVKSKLRMVEKSWITKLEFVRICQEACSDSDQGIGVAKTLDDSGTVIVLGNVVFLRPEQVAKAVGALLPPPVSASIDTNDPRIKEFEELEKQKTAIDKKADSLVRRELWCGLGYLVLQTAGFMRLTFWELTWDVMEPICFYVTSVYFMAGYTFFLRTSIEPSFEGFFRSRFASKHKRIMKMENFDTLRYNELCRAFGSSSLFEHASSSSSPSVDTHGKALCGTVSGFKKSNSVRG